MLNTERIVTTASLIGAGRLAKRLAVQYANDRKVFGGKPTQFVTRACSFRWPSRITELQCARLMNLKAAALCDQGCPMAPRPTSPS